MKVLFIAPSQYSIGELHNAIYLARQLLQHGVSCHFLTSTKFSDYARQAGMVVTPLTRQVKQTMVVDACIRSFQPNIVILADYHILEIESQLVDLNHIVSLDIPVATIDSLSFATQSMTLYNELFRHGSNGKGKSRMEYETKLRKAPESMRIIRTCPINHPRQEDENIVPVTLYTEAFSIDSEVRRKVRADLGCSDEDKLIMLSKAAWANFFVKMRRIESGIHMNKKYSYEHMIQQLMLSYLGEKELPSKVIIVGIGPEDNYMAIQHQKQIQFKAMPFLNLDEYEQLLFSCDLFITDNITSCSMAKAVFGYVPVLSLMNSQLQSNEQGDVHIPDSWEKYRNQLEPIIEQWQSVLATGIYPFITFPNGWVDELSPLLTDNPWLEAIQTAEIFDIQGTGTLMYDLLYCKETKQAVYERQESYIQQIIQAPNAMDMYNQLVGNKEENRNEDRKCTETTIR